jgi:hypothetical protein
VIESPRKAIWWPPRCAFASWSATRFCQDAAGRGAGTTASVSRTNVGTGPLARSSSSASCRRTARTNGFWLGSK